MHRSWLTLTVTHSRLYLRAIPKKASRAIAGLSMGGGHTFAATTLYPDKFDYICPLSAGARESDTLDAQLLGIKKEAIVAAFLIFHKGV